MFSFHHVLDKQSGRERRKKERKKERKKGNGKFRVSDLDDKGTECLSFYVHTAMKTKQIKKNYSLLERVKNLKIHYF